ncbi:hypothetical protein [Halorubrum sp. DTA46]
MTMLLNGLLGNWSSARSPRSWYARRRRLVGHGRRAGALARTGAGF